MAAYPMLPYAWTVVAILIATAVLSYTDRQVLSLLVDPIRADLGISDTEISLLLGTAFAVVYGVAGIPLGYLADRTSRRNLIFAGVLVGRRFGVVYGVAGIPLGYLADRTSRRNLIFAGVLVWSIGTLGCGLSR